MRSNSTLHQAIVTSNAFLNPSLCTRFQESHGSIHLIFSNLRNRALLTCFILYVVLAYLI